MTAEPLPGQLEEKRIAVERLLGRPVVVRGVQTPHPDFRGRLRVEPGRVVIEYQIPEHGYFWHVPIIEKLLEAAMAGESSVELTEPSSGGEALPPAR